MFSSRAAGHHMIGPGAGGRREDDCVMVAAEGKETLDEAPHLEIPSTVPESVGGDIPENGREWTESASIEEVLEAMRRSFAGHGCHSRGQTCRSPHPNTTSS